MRSPLSPIIADLLLVMQDLETSILSTLNIDVSFYYRYVDDISLCTSTDNVTQIVDKFNEYHERLKFTVEREVDHFLDISIKIIDEREYTLVL